MPDHDSSDQEGPSAEVNSPEISSPEISSLEISAAEAARLVDGGQATLVDVREPEEWQAGHAPQAIAVPLSDLQASNFSPDQLVVVVCRSGGRSAVGTQVLRAGQVGARNLVGGMNAWAAIGLPVIRDDGSEGRVI